LNFFQYRCELVAKVPRTWCRKDGVHQVLVPWAREGSGFTLLMEALVMCLNAQMPVDGIADLLQESDTRLWRVLIHYVEQAQARRDWKTVRRIAVDETSARRGHRYVTNVLDCDGAGLLLMVEGRSSQALGSFAQALREHGGDPTQIQPIAMDMSPAYLKGAADGCQSRSSGPGSDRDSCWRSLDPGVRRNWESQRSLWAPGRYLCSGTILVSA
jgi:transposase